MERSISLLVFALDDQRYALHLSAVDRVVRMVDITALPNTPEIVLGVINVKGRVIPVVNVRRRFQLPDREIALTDQLVIAHTAAHRPVALVANSVIGTLEYPAPNFVEAERIFPGIEHLDGVAKFEDGLIFIHSIARFLSLDEVRSLDQAISATGDR